MTQAQRTTLVTGGAGFIGSHLVERLVQRGDHVIVIDDLSTGSKENLRNVDPNRVTLIEATVSQGLSAIGNGQSAIGRASPIAHCPLPIAEIYHLAAAVGVRLVIDKPVHTIETNVHETSAILRFAADAGTPILIASTSEVYGKSPKTPFSEDDDVVYGPTSFSRWSYACSKAIDEHLALAYHRDCGLPVVIARFFNTVGPRQIGKYGMVLPRFVAAAIDGVPLEVHGDGHQSRCFCDVRDVVPALPQLIDVPDCRGKVFNIGSDHPITIADLAQLVKNTLRSDSPVVRVPYDRAFAPGFEDLRTRVPDLSRIRSAIAFEPKITIERTIRDMAGMIAQARQSKVESEVARP